MSDTRTSKSFSVLQSQTDIMLPSSSHLLFDSLSKNPRSQRKNRSKSESKQSSGAVSNRANTPLGYNILKSSLDPRQLEVNSFIQLQCCNPFFPSLFIFFFLIHPELSSRSHPRPSKTKQAAKFKQSFGLEDYPKLSVQDRIMHLTQKCSDMLAVQGWLDSARLLVKNIYNVFNKIL